MVEIKTEDQLLSPLRDDLEISPGAPFLSGAPGWVIRDPVRHRFFQIGQRTIDILSRWSTGRVNRLKAQLFSEKAIQLSDEELDALTHFLKHNQLLEGGEAGTAARYAHLDEKRALSRLLYNVQRLMFFRVPVARPDAFLRATWPIVRPLFSLAFVWVSSFMLLVGLYLASHQLTEIEAHIRNAFTWGGGALFIAAIAILKMLHEFGHAYQAIGRGLRVPVMGIVFFAFLPLLYTDVTDAWRLRRRYDRVMVDLGGILVEITVAVYATLIWTFLPDGPLRMVVFAIATSSWVLSLLVNLNPFMRFDGYYILSDSLGIHNLQSRAFALGKWAMRRTLFGLDDTIPEHLNRSTSHVLIAYAYAVWVYRFFLFLGISVLIYSMFFKMIGVLFLLLFVAAFIVKPILMEVWFWIGSRDRILRSRRSLVTMGLLISLLAVFFWPISTRVYVPAILEEARQHAIFPPAAARLDEVFFAEGDTVVRGDPLFLFSDPEMPTRIEQSKTRIAMYNARLLSSAGDTAERAESTVIARLLDEEIENLSGLEEVQDNFLVVAAMSGRVREVSPELNQGVWYTRTHLLGRIIESGNLTVRGFIDETDLLRLDPTKGARFIAEELSIPVLLLEDIEVSDFAVKQLPDGYLAQPNGGMIAVGSLEPGDLQISGGWYQVSGRPTSDGENWLVDDRVQRGVIVMYSIPQSMARRVGNRIARVLVREFEF